MDVDRIYQLMGTAVKRIFGFYVKRPIQRFNVDNRAEKVIDKQNTVPKVAPRHEGTEHLFRQISQNNPNLRNELNEKREDLLQRLSSVRVVSKEIQMSEQDLKEMDEIRQKVKSRLPQDRTGTEIPLHAYTEPAHVPIGRISLLRSLDFIGKHHKNPEEYDSKTISKQYRLNEEDVKNVLEYFKPFYKERPSEEEEEDTGKVLGIPKAQFQSIISSLKPKSTIEKEQIEGKDNQKLSDKNNK